VERRFASQMQLLNCFAEFVIRANLSARHDRLNVGGLEIEFMRAFEPARISFRPLYGRKLQ
jgi:hypothetical protein